MPYVTEQRLRNRADQETKRVQKGALERLNEVTASTRSHFDIFLSHSIRDEKLVDGARLELEDKGFSVYVDWIEDPQLSRTSITRETANILRQRMRQSKSLIYMHTENSPNSKWMPWELGYFDGFNGRVSILPVLKTPSSTYTGQEYLGIYPSIDFDTIKGTTKEALWVMRSSKEYAGLDAWMKDPAAIKVHS